MDYLLAENIVRVRTDVVFEDDDFDPGGERRASATSTVTLEVRGDAGDGRCSVDLHDRGSDTDVTVGLSPDGRLTSLSYKSVGTGPRVVSAGAKLLGVVVGVAARVGFGGFGGLGGVVTLLQGELVEPSTRSPEQSAFASWRSDNKAAGDLLVGYRALVEELAAELLQARTAATAPDAGAAQLARVRRLALLVDDARAEVDRLESLYRSWRAGTVTMRTEVWHEELSLDTLPRAGWGSDLDPGRLTGRARALWDDAGVGLQVEGPEPRSPHHADSDDEHQRVSWRVPRLDGISVWRKDDAGRALLERRELVAVVDRHSATEEVRLDRSFFGSHGAEVLFGDLGAPVSVGTARTSAAGAIADALGTAPGELLGGLETATKLSSTLTGLRDAGDERRLAGLTRRVENAQQELELKGLAATAADHARLKELQQQVEVTTAEGALAPPSAAARLEDELRLVTAQRDLEAARRSAAVDMELSEVRTEIARLEAQVELLEAREAAGAR